MSSECAKYTSYQMIGRLGVNEGFDSTQAFFFDVLEARNTENPLVDKVYNPYQDNTAVGLRTSCLYDAYRIIRAERDAILELSPTAIAKIVRVQLDEGEKKAFALRMTRVQHDQFLEQRVRRGETIDDLMEPYADLVANYVINRAHPSQSEPFVYLNQALNENQEHLHNLHAPDGVGDSFNAVYAYVARHKETINQSAETEELIKGHADIRLGNVAYDPSMGLLTFDCAPKKEWRETFRRENGLSMYLDLMYWKQDHAARLYVERFNAGYEKALREKYGDNAAEKTLKINEVIDPVVVFRRSAIMTIVGLSQNHDNLRDWGIQNMSYIASQFS